VQFPRSLAPGDKVCFIAPARKVLKEELTTGINVLSSWGLEVVETPNLFAEDNQFAGSDQERSAHVQWALDHKEIKAMFCVRGGYGTSRIVDSLDFEMLLEYPKWLVGFSDITILLNQFYNTGISSIHGPVALLFSDKTDDEMMLSLKETLFSNKNATIYSSSNRLNKFGEIEGQLVGGNLSVLVDQIATDSFPQLEGSILFLEDLDEYLYHIDRLIIHLKRIGAFSKIRGLVVGYMSDMHDNKIPFGKTSEEIIAEATQGLNIPIAFEMPIGHEPMNMPVVIGANYRLTVNAKGAELRFI